MLLSFNPPLRIYAAAAIHDERYLQISKSYIGITYM